MRFLSTFVVLPYEDKREFDVCLLHCRPVIFGMMRAIFTLEHAVFNQTKVLEGNVEEFFSPLGAF